MRKNDVTDMTRYETRLQAQGFHLLAGVDEVGRGPLAGPVAAAAVILPVGFSAPDIKDSKKLAPGKRRRLAAEIKRQALDWSVAMVSPAVIDEINILEATKKAMRLALAALVPAPDYVLTDAVHLEMEVPHMALIKGDNQSISIASASIIAKVLRDDCMTALDQLYPGYGLAKHKGYGTAEHLHCLRAHGPSPVHRCSFRPVSACCGKHSLL